MQLSGGKGLTVSAQRVERDREEARVDGAAAQEALVIVMHAVVGHDARGDVASVRDRGEHPSRAMHGAALGRTEFEREHEVMKAVINEDAVGSEVPLVSDAHRALKDV
eukprot:9238144-Pyramimonas_sp.AAC.1